MKSFGEFLLSEKNVPDNPALWKKAIAKAKAKFDVYPSAYANAWASKWYKGEGGTWSVKKEEVEIDEAMTPVDALIKKGKYLGDFEGATYYEMLGRIYAVRGAMLTNHGKVNGPGVKKLKKSLRKAIGLDESTPAYRKMLKDYEKSDDKKVFDILDKEGYRLGEQGDTLVRNMLKKFKGNVKKAAAEIMKKYPGMKKEGFASDAQRRAAFASGYKAKGKKGKKNEALMDQEREDKPLIKWFDEFEKLLKKAGGKYKDIDPTDMLKLYYQGKNPKAAIKELL